jgi:hypothetical protein
MTMTKQEQIDDLREAMRPVEALGAQVVRDLDAQDAARLALYLLDHAGLSVGAQSVVLGLLETEVL